MLQRVGFRIRALGIPSSSGKRVALGVYGCRVKVPVSGALGLQGLEIRDVGQAGASRHSRVRMDYGARVQRERGYGFFGPREMHSKEGERRNGVTGL